MYTEGYDQWFKVNKNVALPMAEWNKVTTELCQKITQQNLELMGENFSRVSDQLKRLTSIKKPEDMLSLQKECLDEDLKATMEWTHKYIQLLMENMEVFTKLCNPKQKSTAQGESPERF